MSEDTSGRRPTRRTRATRPVERGGVPGAPTLGQSLRITPIPNIHELLAIARAQRAREDTAADQRKTA